MAEVDKTNELPEEEVEESEVDVEIEGEEQVPEEQQPEEDLQTGHWVKINRQHLKLACCLSYGIIGYKKICETYKLLRSVRPSAVDLLYINHIQKHGNCYVLNPVMCYQDHNLGSDVTSKGGNVQSFVKKKGAYFYTLEQEDKLK